MRLLKAFLKAFGVLILAILALLAVRGFGWAIEAIFSVDPMISAAMACALFIISIAAWAFYPSS